MKIAVYGLGKLGSPLFDVLTKAGHDVVGVDPLKALSPQPSEVSFVVVPTPSTKDGDFDATLVERCLEDVASVNLAGHLAVLVSTVSPGTCDTLIGQFPLQLVYNPTFIALDKVVHGLVHPDQLFIGTPDAVDAEAVRTIWRSVFSAYCDEEWVRPIRVHVGSYVEIELLKLATNCTLATKISLANSLGELFAAFGVERKKVECIGFDQRIGTAFFRPGGPVGGPCLPRDNAALLHAADQADVELPFAQLTDTFNRQFQTRITGIVSALGKDLGGVGILGLAYKHGTGVTDSALGKQTSVALTLQGVHHVVYDPVLPSDSLEAVLLQKVILVAQPELAEHTSEHHVVINPWA